MPVTNRLQQPLDRLCREFDWARRVEQDAIQFPHRYHDPADIEIAGLFASCMAYGRVDLFGAWVTWVLYRMGESPARFASCRCLRQPPTSSGRRPSSIVCSLWRRIASG